MDHRHRFRPSPALIVALIALVIAMSGAAVALPGKNTVGSGDIKKGAIGSKQIKPRAIKGSDVQDDALKGKQVLEEKLEVVPEAETVQTVRPFGDAFERVDATDGADTAAARAAAPKVTLATAGQLRVYGKCFRNTTTDTFFALAFIETSADGAIFESGPSQLEGTGGFLDVATAETDRTLLGASTGGNGSVLDTGDWYAMAPDGTGIGGEVAVAAKNGTVPGGDGVFGDGNVCLFGGDATG
jgi:hypothetical protein